MVSFSLGGEANLECLFTNRDRQITLILPGLIYANWLKVLEGKTKVEKVEKNLSGNIFKGNLSFYKSFLRNGWSGVQSVKPLHNACNSFYLLKRGTMVYCAHIILEK